MLPTMRPVNRTAGAVVNRPRTSAFSHSHLLLLIARTQIRPSRRALCGRPLVNRSKKRARPMDVRMREPIGVTRGAPSSSTLAIAKCIELAKLAATSQG